jgi:putative DNA primase/helicase
MSANTKTLAQQLAERRAANNSHAPKIEQPVVTKTVEPPPPREPSLFEQYVAHGFALVPLKDNEKRPTANAWNEQRNAVRDPKRAKHLTNAGLLHAFSATAVIDVDNIDASRSWLKDHGISLDDLFNAPDAVRIHSGDPARGKLVYALPSIDADLSDHAKRWPTKQISVDDAIIFELRCGASTGNSSQDVVPPSRNPRTKQRYDWIGDWRKLPMLPPELRALWQSMVAPKMERTADELRPTATWPELEALLTQQDPDGDYASWLRTGMALHFESDGEAFELWDAWSAKSGKYPGAEELRAKWDSFHGSATPVTAGSLRRELVASDADFGPPLTKEQGDAALAAYGVVESPRPTITLDGGQLAANADRCEKILSDELYVRNRELVRIGAARELQMSSGTREIIRSDTQPIIVTVSTEYVQRRLTARVSFQRWDARSKEYIAKDCPKDLAAMIHDRSSDRPAMRTLRSIATAPFIRPNVTVCTEPGYDSLAQVFYAPNADFPVMPAQPTQEDASRALAMLLAPFTQFPLTDAGRAAFASHILTEVVRLAIETSPIFAYTAPEAGTGKTLLSQMAASIAHGTPPALRVWSKKDDTELGKVLFASLLAGDRTIGFDNVTGGSKVYAAELCHFATSINYGGRKLGVSETVALPNTAVVFLTGNNLTPSGDMARRAIVIRLDANVDSHKLRERTFAISDLPGYVKEHRAELLVAALTIVRAFVIAGAPQQANPLPSFEAWSRLARDPLMWLGLPNAVDTQDAETDNEAEPLGAVFDVIAAWRGDQWFTANELATHAMFGGPVRDALVAATCDVSDAKHVGMWLRGHRDRIFNGVKLEAGDITRDGRGGVRGWRLAGAGAPTPPPVLANPDAVFVDPDSDLL